jgi:hypothetical protein
MTAMRRTSTSSSSLECRNDPSIGHSQPRVMSQAARARAVREERLRGVYTQTVRVEEAG